MSRPKYEEIYTEQERQLFYDNFILPVLGENADPSQVELTHYMIGVLLNINTQFALEGTVKSLQRIETNAMFNSMPSAIAEIKILAPAARKIADKMYKTAQDNVTLFQELIQSVANRRKAEADVQQG